MKIVGIPPKKDQKRINRYKRNTENYSFLAYGLDSVF